MLQMYLEDTRDLLNDGEGHFFRQPRLISYINKARRRIAAASGCLRLVPSGVYTVPNQEIYPLSIWASNVQGEMPGAASILFCRSVSIGIRGYWQGGGIVGGGGQTGGGAVSWV